VGDYNSGGSGEGRELIKVLQFCSPKLRCLSLRKVFICVHRTELTWQVPCPVAWARLRSAILEIGSSDVTRRQASLCDCAASV
jgi:hypothetical protein